VSPRSAKRKPVILISAGHTGRQGPLRPAQTRLPAAYADAVTAAGGLPVIAPPVADPDDVACLLDVADGVLLTGGYDLSARTFGKTNHPKTRPMTRRRQAFELALARAALERRTPLFAICLGIQVLNVAAGGTLIQHLPDAVGEAVQHRARGVPDAHTVVLEPGSLAARLTGATRLSVNSTHHQAVGRLGAGLVVSGRCEADGVIEAIEADDGRRFVLGVQWHPERLTDRAPHLALFEGLVTAVRGGESRG